ncbi:hypothetical protein N7523_004853 [Penicillium sp. IBT 18751x]|nr:hypothetical protein N7523_004853 [Penicillium sp. IBT 18751x]
MTSNSNRAIILNIGANQGATKSGKASLGTRTITSFSGLAMLHVVVEEVASKNGRLDVVINNAGSNIEMHIRHVLNQKNGIQEELDLARCADLFTMPMK